MTEEILTLDEAARFLRVKIDLVSQLFEAGEVAGRKIGGEWRTTRRALVRFIEGDTCCGNGGCCRDDEGEETCCNSAGGCCG